MKRSEHELGWIEHELKRAEMSWGELRWASEKKYKTKLTERKWQPKKNHSKGVSQRRKLTAKNISAKKYTDNQDSSQQKNLTAKKFHNEDESQQRKITAKKSHMEEGSL